MTTPLTYREILRRAGAQTECSFCGRPATKNIDELKICNDPECDVTNELSATVIMALFLAREWRK